MMKAINEERIRPLLIYPHNIQFIKGETKLPHNHSEIMNNLRRSMGSTIAFENNPVQGIALYTGIFIVCTAVLLAVGVTALTQINALSRIPRGVIFPALAAYIALGTFTLFIAKTLFNAMRYSPKKMKENFALLIQKGALHKGTLISEKVVNGVYIITYQFASPVGETVTCTYRSISRKYDKNKRERSLIIWYLNNNLNTLL